MVSKRVHTGRSATAGVGLVRRSCRLLLCLALASALLPLAAAPASASQAPDDGQAQGEQAADAIRVTGERLNIPLSSTPGWTNNLWLWRKGRRAFTLSREKQPDPSNRTVDGQLNTTTVVAYDIDALGEVARVTLDRPPATQEAGNFSQHWNTVRHAAVDEDGGRLFVPYANPIRAFHAQDKWLDAARGEGCGYPDERVVCLTGVFVLAGDTLDVVRRIPLPQLSVNGGVIAAPTLVAMSYSPPAGASESGKLYLLVRDEDTYRAGDAQGTLHYVVQVDPDRGQVDWVVRAEACRSVREPQPHNATKTPGEMWDYARRLNEAVVFRGGPPSARSVWVGCHLPSRTATIVRIPLDERGSAAAAPYEPGDPGRAAGKALADGPDALGPSDVARPSNAGPQQVFPGPKNTMEFIADPLSERILLKVVDGNPTAIVWWVFDGRRGAFLGTIGLGAYQFTQTVSGLDPSSGRFYVLAPPTGNLSGGLFTVDVRRTPVPQALVFPHLTGLLIEGELGYNVIPIQVDYGDGAVGTPRRLFVRKGDLRDTRSPEYEFSPYFYDILEDRLPLTEDPVQDLFAGRTLDLDEAAGVTQVSFDGAARGFAVRALFVGGLDTVARAGPADPTLVTEVLPDRYGPDVAPCSRANRQVVLGFVGPRDAAVIDGSGSRGGVAPLVVDSGTRGDAELPWSRCAPGFREEWVSPLNFSQQRSRSPVAGITLQWEHVWQQALFGHPPIDEPSLPWLFGDGSTECVSSGDQPSASFGDPVTGAFAAAISCETEEASGYGYARGVGVGDVSVSEAVSSFRIYRDPGRGIVSRVESIARGLAIEGVGRIDTVRGSAESWANGRTQPVPASERDPGYEPNCDFERTAGTCFSRSIFGVSTPVYSCGPCGDEGALVEGLSRALGANGRVRLREPDTTLRDGAPNGYLAAIQKPAHERFSDVVLNDDLLQTTLPVLEITRYTIPGAGAGKLVPTRRGLQVYQFAGVEVSSSYGIQCLLVYDEATNTCAAAQEDAGSLTVRLEDGETKPLAGGAFEVRTDVDGDGVLGLADTLLPEGACVTAEDGTGTCSFEGLRPGTYLVSQTAAPPGYAKIEEPWVSEIAPGEARTVTFTNVSNVSVIEVKATDQVGAPLAGAVFAVLPDPDADGKVAAGVAPAATCTTDAKGTCSMRVPTGSYVLVQTAAPGGLEPIEPVAFALTGGGQTAAVGVVNYAAAPAPEVGPVPPAPGPEVVVSDPPPMIPVVEETEPFDGAVEGEATPPPAVFDPGQTIERIIRAPRDVLGLLAREPLQAVAWTSVLALLVLALMTVRRRALLATLAGPALLVGLPGRPGGGGPGGGGPGGHRRRAPAGSRPAAGSTSSTAVLERPQVAGAAPSHIEQPAASVIVAVSSPALAELVTGRLATAERVNVIATVDQLDELERLLRTTPPDVLVIELPLLGERFDIKAPALFAPERTVGLIPSDSPVEVIAGRAYLAGIGALLVADDDIGNGQLAYAVRCVAAGKPCYGPTVQAALLSRASVLWRGGKQWGLTPRELEVARLAASGVRRSEIARTLVVSDDTVKAQLRAVRAKLGVQDPHDRDELRNRLDQLGLLHQELDS